MLSFLLESTSQFESFIDFSDVFIKQINLIDKRECSNIV
jgi:hypothetical protein